MDQLGQNNSSKYAKLKKKYKTLREEYLRVLENWEDTQKRIKSLTQERLFLREKLESFLKNQQFIISDDVLASAIISKPVEQQIVQNPFGIQQQISKNIPIHSNQHYLPQQVGPAQNNQGNQISHKKRTKKMEQLFQQQQHQNQQQMNIQHSQHQYQQPTFITHDEPRKHSSHNHSQGLHQNQQHHSTHQSLVLSEQQQMNGALNGGSQINGQQHTNGGLQQTKMDVHSSFIDNVQHGQRLPHQQQTFSLGIQQPSHHPSMKQMQQQSLNQSSQSSIQQHQQLQMQQQQQQLMTERNGITDFNEINGIGNQQNIIGNSPFSTQPGIKWAGD